MGTHYRGTPTEVRALNAWIPLARAAESVAARLQESYASHGLTAGQFGALEALLHLGPLPQGGIARKLLRSGGNLTVVIDHLERRGLVRRERSARDRRVILVRLTAPGRRVISGIFPRHVRGIVKQMSVLSAREQESLRALCRRVGKGEPS